MKRTTPLVLAVLILIGMSSALHVHAQTPQTILVKRIAVVDELSRPVLAKLNLLDSENKETFFADTDERGIAEPNKVCPVGARIRTHPAVPRYLAYAKHPICASDMRIPLRRAGVAIEMARIADGAFKEQNFGRAAMIYTDAAYRLSTTDAVAAAKLETKAYESAAKQLGSIGFSVYDPEQKKNVLTTDGIDALRKFQMKNNLSITGRLDVQTTQTLAAEPVFPHIRSAYGAIEKQ